VLRSLRWRLPWFRGSAKRALVLAGGGVIGGMYEVGVLAALDDALPGFRANQFDLYVGSSSGSVVTSLMANGIRPRDLYEILDEERDDPLNFQRGSVYHKGAFSSAARNLAQFVWAVGKKAVTGFRLEWPDLLARSGADMPAGFFSVAPLEKFMREAFAGRGLPNSFRDCHRPLLIPAMELDRAERAVFGAEPLMDVPISEAIAASSAIPGFFEPVRIGGRDYVDGDVGYTGHADLAVEQGATCVVVLNPQVPIRVGSPEEPDVRSRGLYAIMEQVGHITSLNILELGLRELRLRRPDLELHLVQPESKASPLVGPSMGFEASRAALRYGFASVTEWLAGDGAAFAARFR
jgi:predicted acylesterase/phospholipase RssA